MRSFILSVITIGALTIAAPPSFAQTTDQTLGTVADNVTTSFSSLSKTITAPAYALGVGYAAQSVLRFKAQHRPDTGRRRR